VKNNFYTFVCKSLDFDGESYILINAETLVDSMVIFAERFSNEPYYDVKVFEVEFGENGLCELYPDE
jgi:hypothetical protein